MNKLNLDARYWQRIYTTGVVARTLNNKIIAPISERTLRVTINSYILAVGVSSTSAKPTWKLGFWLSQVIQVQGAGFAEYNPTPIILGLTLVKFEPLTTAYQLKARFPSWHKDLSISIWKYRGLTSDPLDDISLRLARIEQKIDYASR